MIDVRFTISATIARCFTRVITSTGSMDKIEVHVPRSRYQPEPLIYERMNDLLRNILSDAKEKLDLDRPL